MMSSLKHKNKDANLSVPFKAYSCNYKENLKFMSSHSHYFNFLRS